jgi:hypothetical protein
MEKCIREREYVSLKRNVHNSKEIKFKNLKKSILGFLSRSQTTVTYGIIVSRSGYRDSDSSAVATQPLVERTRTAIPT